MDQNTIIELLRATTNNQAEIREPAERSLEQVHKIIGFTPALLQIVLNPQFEIHIRQAASIYLKNNVNKYWEAQSAQAADLNHGVTATPQSASEIEFKIHEQDKQVIRDAIVDAIVQLSDQKMLSSHLSMVANMIIKHDFPHQWPGVIDKINMYLQLPDANKWSGALVTLYQLAKIFEYKTIADRQPFIEALKILLPIIYQRMTDLIQKDPLSEQSCQLQKQILKIFHATIQYSLPLVVLTREVFSGWMELVLEVAKREINEDLQKNVDTDERPSLIWWKCKKWSLHLLTRIFERYGSPGHVNKEYKEFADWYIKTFSGVVVQTIVKILELYARNTYVSPRVMQQTLNYLNTAVLHSMTWKMLKGDMMAIIEKVVFPLMCYSDEDEELWQSDPREYIRIKFDVFEDYVSPVTAGQTLLHSCCGKRKDMLQKVMSLIVAVLNDPRADPKHKDGALHMVGSIAHVMLKKQVFKDQLEQLLVAYVFPLFSCPHHFLRARACWVLNYFAETEFKLENNLISATQSIQSCLLQDRELPVKVEAASCLLSLLGSQENIKEVIRPNVKAITMELLQMIRVTESEDVMQVMQKIVYVFPDDLYIIAVDMTNHLATTFLQLITSPEDEADEKTLAAMAVLNTIDTVLTMMDEQPEVVAKLEPIVVNVIITIFDRSLAELYEEATTLLSTITTDQVSQESWRVFQTLYAVFKRDGYDYFTDMMSPIHNYITVDPQTFISNRDNLVAIFDMCRTILTDPKCGEEIESYAAKLLEIIILQFKTEINDCIPSFIELAITRLRREVSSAELRTLLIQIVIAALYTNYELLLSTLDKLQPDQPQQLFTTFVKQWLKDITEFVGLHDRKMCVIGLCTIAMLPADKRPPVVNELADQIVPSILVLFEKLKIAYQKKANADSDSETDEDEIASDTEGDCLEDDQDHVGSKYS